MVSPLIDEAYLTWLYGQIGIIRLKNPARTHWSLARQLYKKEFLWFVPNDDNRLEDGRSLRYEFFSDFEIEHPDPVWTKLGCSMLEMLVALSRRLSYYSDRGPREWFWEMLDNLGISMSMASDRHYSAELAQLIDEALDRVIWRTYAPDGTGGLFPLVETNKDQRTIEIWYQMAEYIANDI